MWRYNPQQKEAFVEFKVNSYCYSGDGIQLRYMAESLLRGPLTSLLKEREF